jgi:hypothetical protein
METRFFSEVGTEVLNTTSMSFNFKSTVQEG